jgi:hypothetical protein
MKEKKKILINRKIKFVKTFIRITWEKIQKLF